jgi:hypothetical protein
MEKITSSLKEWHTWFLILTFLGSGIAGLTGIVSPHVAEILALIGSGCAGIIKVYNQQITTTSTS